MFAVNASIRFKIHTFCGKWDRCAEFKWGWKNGKRKFHFDMTLLVLSTRLFFLSVTVVLCQYMLLPLYKSFFPVSVTNTRHFSAVVRTRWCFFFAFFCNMEKYIVKFFCSSALTAMGTKMFLHGLCLCFCSFLFRNQRPSGEETWQLFYKCCLLEYIDLCIFSFLKCMYMVMTINMGKLIFICCSNISLWCCSLPSHVLRFIESLMYRRSLSLQR